MADNGGIRLGRALLGAVAVEVILGVVAIPFALLVANPNALLNLIVPPASFIIAALVVVWLFAKSDRPVANGIATGVMGVLLYAVLTAVAYGVAPDKVDLNQTLGLSYLASHVLKIVGGAAGGWWLARKRGAAA